MLSEFEIQELRTGGDIKLLGFTESGTLYEVCDTALILFAKLRERTEALAKCQCWNLAMVRKQRLDGIMETIACECPPCLAQKQLAAVKGEKRER